MPEPHTTPLIRLEPWGEDDLDLLRRLNAPDMTAHLGGPETEEKLLDRHRRYLASAATGRDPMFRVVLLAEGRPVGSVGFWGRHWRDATVYEMGWSVLPDFQGRGIAVAAAAAAADLARADGRFRHAHAFPSVDNPASNAVCRKAGFTLLGPCDVEYPPGNPMRCNDWQLDLATPRPGAAPARSA